MKKIIKKPWGREEILYNKNGVQVKTLTIKKGELTSLHYHKHKEEVIVAVTDCEVTIGDKTTKLFNGNMLTISPGKIHTFKALDKDIIIVETSYGDDKDIIRLEDRYERIRKPGRPKKLK